MFELNHTIRSRVIFKRTYSLSITDFKYFLELWETHFYRIFQHEMKSYRFQTHSLIISSATTITNSLGVLCCVLSKQLRVKCSIKQSSVVIIISQWKLPQQRQ